MIGIVSSASKPSLTRGLRFPGSDVNLSFTVSVAVVPGGAVGGMTVGSPRGRRAAAVGPDRDQAVAGAESLGPEDHVVLKSTSMPWAIAPGG